MLIKSYPVARGVDLNRFLHTDLDLFHSLKFLVLKLHVFVIGNGLVLSYLIEEHLSSWLPEIQFCKWCFNVATGDSHFWTSRRRQCREF